MQCHTQTGNITTNIKIEVDFNLPRHSAANVTTQKYHVDDSAKGQYFIITGIYILAKLVLSKKLSDHITKSDDGKFKGSTSLMVDLGTYKFKYLNKG